MLAMEVIYYVISADYVALKNFTIHNGIPGESKMWMRCVHGPWLGKRRREETESSYTRIMV
jgi:hypothetical protein